MGQALYRKHRSRKLSEIVGQEHITKTLSEALKQGRVSHAYLLTGPRGVGKTSIARILAHEVNNLPYGGDESHIDIIEIDAASNRRIDEIRELREKVHIAPAMAKYKVYIIDEVHMLTREAFNALLKTLEEPPEHAIFILATTDSHKLPETIVSRTQRFSFKPVDKDKVVKHLADIAKQEKIKISPEALELLAEHGEGSFRDSISMLDQVSSKGSQVELEDVRRQLGLPPASAILELLELLSSNGDTAAVMQALSKLYDQGYQPASIAKQIGQSLRAQLSNDTLQLNRRVTLTLLTQLINVPASREPASLLEIILLASLPTSPTPSPSLPQNDKDASSHPPESPATPLSQPEIKDSPKQTKTASKKVQSANTTSPKRQLDESVWPEVLEALKQKHNTLYGVARMAQPSIEDGNLQLAFVFGFHKKRLSEPTNRQVITKIVKDLTGETVEIDCIVSDSAKTPVASIEPNAPNDSHELSAISNIFGGGELLES